MFTDTHAHLFFDDFSGDIDVVLQRAAAAGADSIIVPATDVATAKKALELCSRYDSVYSAAGVHPHDAKSWHAGTAAELRELLRHPKMVAVGEIGLDYYYDYSPKEAQHRAFREQIELALAEDLPVIIHNRQSDDDVLRIVSEYCKDGLRGQFHCFNAPADHAREIIAMKFFISFTGNITFKKADALRGILKLVPLNQLLLETDSPFMAPVPLRGKRNEPANIPIIANAVAEQLGVSADEVYGVTTANARNLFGLQGQGKPQLTYPLYKSLYINVTNRCNADCVFCDRKGSARLSGYHLKMAKKDEPAAAAYIAEIGDPAGYEEIVFCGYGEPTIRWDVVKAVAAYVKQHGGRTRLNTNGHGSIINQRDITQELPGLIDTVSVSLNSSSRKQYAELMRVPEEMYDAMLAFARGAKAQGVDVVLSIVSIDEVEKEKARAIAEQELGVAFRERSYF